MRDEGELRDADEELLYRREFRVGAHGKEVHSLVLRLVDEGLDPGVWLQTAETPQVMEIAAPPIREWRRRSPEIPHAGCSFL